jgi:hypothetical protein
MITLVKEDLLAASEESISVAGKIRNAEQSMRDMVHIYRVINPRKYRNN